MAYVPKKKHGPSAADTSRRRPLDEFPPLCTKPLEELQPPRPGEYVVLKFGGSSLKDPERLSVALDTILMEYSQLRRTDEQQAEEDASGNRKPSRLAVVVSAMGGTTDLLIDAATLASNGDIEEAYKIVERITVMCRANVAIAGELTEQMQHLLASLRKMLLGMSLVRELTPAMLDSVLSFGERLSALTVRELLEHRGISAIFVDARDWLITDESFGQAKVDRDATYKQLLWVREQWSDAVAVVTGFIGRTHDDRTTTLGRNGSDYTAAVLGAVLKADRVIINTDVAGVMTADPSIVKHAYPVRKLCYDEALELAVYGVNVFHPRTMLPLIETGIPMIIRKASHPHGPSTLITATEGECHITTPTCVASREQLALLQVRSNKLQDTGARLAGRVMVCLSNAGIATYNCTESAHGQVLSVVVQETHAQRAIEEIERELRMELRDKEVESVQLTAPVTLLSLVQEKGQHVRCAAAKFFGAIAARNIICVGVSNTDRALSCLIRASDTAKAVSAVHDAFNFAHQRLSVLLLAKGRDPCWNGVARALIQMIQDQASNLRSMNSIEIILVGVANAQIVFDPAGITPAAAVDALLANAEKSEVAELSDDLLDAFATLPVPLIVDCSALHRESLYQRALSRGVHIVCANVHSCAYLGPAITSKLPIPISLKKLPSTALYPGLLACDTSVGTSIPILDALRRVVKTGDVPLKVEASLSGSMGFVCDRLNHGASLKDAVLEALNINILEANPWDDLRGRDVERKFRVISLCLGIMELEHGRLTAEGLVPAWLEEKYPWETTGVAGLAAAMEEYEPQFKRLHPHLGSRGRRLRFIATMNFSYKCTCDARNPQAADPVSRTGSRFSSLYDVTMQAGCQFVPKDHPLYSLSGTQISVALTTERHRTGPLILKGSGAGFAEGAAGLLNDMITVAHALKG